MNNKYDIYLDNGTRKILEYFVSADISVEEREAIASAFSEELAAHIGNTEGLTEYEPLIYAASLQFIDSRITRILLKPDACFADYESGKTLCTRQQNLLKLFTDNGWKVPQIDNSDPEECKKAFQKHQEAISVSTRVVYEDKKIDELVALAQKELSVNTCDQLMSLANQLQKDIDECKQKAIPLPNIHNRDTQKLIYWISETRKAAEKKEAVYREIKSTDSQISSLASSAISSSEQCKNAVSLCQKLRELLNVCRKNRWSAPAIRCTNPEQMIVRFKHYDEMIAIDQDISKHKDLLSSNKQYAEYLALCSEQQKKVSDCVRNGWLVPSLTNNNLEALIKSANSEKERKDKRKHRRKTLTFVAVIIAALALVSLWGIGKYRSGKAKIPFDASYVTGKELTEICDELENAGFSNIISKPTDSGWMDGNKVTNVTIDNMEDYSKGPYLDKDVSVVVTYSSTDRVNVTELLKDWTTSDYNDIKQIMEEAEFSNVTTEKVVTEEKEKTNLTAGITLNGETYTNEPCYLPKGAPVIISYYTLQIGIGNENSQFIGQDYENVVTSLQESGFTNVQTQQIYTGWAKGKSVVGVTVNNLDSYTSSDMFAPNVKIVVKYSSDDRIDISDIVEKWETQKYESVVEALKEKGFTTVKIFEEVTETKTQNGLVSSIMFGNEVFTSGPCYLPETTSISIGYYHLKIEIGQTEEGFTNEDNYEDLIKTFQEKGFTNLFTQEYYAGWAKGNSVVGVTVNRDTSYARDDLFEPDARIIIKYSSDDRIDISSIIADWKTSDYETIVKALEEKGFNKIKVIKDDTETKSQNRLVSSISINDTDYTSGECYVPVTASFKIHYYHLRIKIGQTANALVKNKNYHEVVEELKELGFSNIKLQRANDIGWFPMHEPEGSIKTLKINDTGDFSGEDVFNYDDEIVIVVHTANTGCDDITEVSK